MAIQWYPGHMHKAGREMQAALREVDALIEVRDARLPWSSANPVLAELGDERPRLVVLTRIDLADPELTSRWLNVLQQPTVGRPATETPAHEAIALDLTQESAAIGLPRTLDVLAGPARSNRPGPRTAMIVGIPNVGKSTLINRLAGRTIARTGNEPAVTKRQQSIALPGGVGERWRLRDTPGVLWPNVENPSSGYRLAASGAIRDTAMESDDVGVTLIEELLPRYRPLLELRYGEDLPEDEPVAVLEEIGLRRGCLGGGGLVDFDRAARLLLDDFRSGRLGRITLETPQMAEQEAIDLIEMRAQREAKKEARKKKSARRRS